MTTIPAENVEIAVGEGLWQLIPVDEYSVSSQPVFQVARGGGVLEYTPAFGQAHKLPGTVLSVEYIRAVVVGYDKRERRWMLGFNVARSTSDKARWLQLVRWPEGDNMQYAAAAQHAGRALAEHVGCPLQIFGAKKLTSPLDPAVLHGVTGPLVPHKREDIGPQQVKLLAQSTQLPLEFPNLWLGRARGSVTLRLAKDASTDKRGKVAPAFNQCVIDPGAGRIRLTPPTGLLGAFLGTQGRSLETASVRNVELRHTATQRYLPKDEGKGLITEITQITHTWEVYLTLPDESLLLAQTHHETSSELLRHRAMAGDKFSVDTEAGINYLRQHQADQEAYDKAQGWAESASIVIAATLSVPVVKTEVEEGMA